MRFKAFSFFIELKKYALKLQKRTKKRTTFQIGVDFIEMPEERAYSNGIQLYISGQHSGQQFVCSEIHFLAYYDMR